MFALVVFEDGTHYVCDKKKVTMKSGTLCTVKYSDGRRYVAHLVRQDDTRTLLDIICKDLTAKISMDDDESESDGLMSEENPQDCIPPNNYSPIICTDHNPEQVSMVSQSQAMQEVEKTSLLSDVVGVNLSTSDKQFEEIPVHQQQNDNTLLDNADPDLSSDIDTTRKPSNEIYEQVQKTCLLSDVVAVNSAAPEKLDEEIPVQPQPSAEDFIHNENAELPLDVEATGKAVMQSSEEVQENCLPLDAVGASTSSPDKLTEAILHEQSSKDVMLGSGVDTELPSGVETTEQLQNNFFEHENLEVNGNCHLTDSERNMLTEIECDLYESLDDAINCEGELTNLDLMEPDTLRIDGSLHCDDHRLSGPITSSKPRKRIAYDEAVSEDEESVDDSMDEYVPDSYSESTSDDEEEPLDELHKSQTANKSLEKSNDSNTLNLSLPLTSSAPDDSQVTFDLASSRQKHSCYYCGKAVFKMARHLETVHKDEDKVKLFMHLPKNNPLRKKKIEELRKRGNYENNSNATRNNGLLNVCRRPNKGTAKSVGDYTPCPSCKGYFMKSNIRHHFAHCIGHNSNTANRTKIQNRGILVMARKIDGKFHPAASTVVKNAILPYIKEDEVGTLIRHDEFIILYANNLAEQFTSQDEHSMIRQKLRTIGRFLVTLKTKNPAVTDFASIYDPRFYRDCLESAKIMAGYDESTGNFEAPSTATSIGTSLKQIGLFLEALYIERREDEKKKMAKDFVKLMKQGFLIINRRAAETQTKHSRQKKVTLPSTDDIQKLNSFLEQKRREAFDQLQQEFSHEAWISLAKATLVLVQVFNRRRQGEISKISIEDFRCSQRLDERTNKDLFKTLSAECKAIARKYVRFEVRGKRGRTVPVLLNTELFESIELILKLRKQAKVSSKNNYVFGIPSIDKNRQRRLIACDLMRQYSKECGADIPATLRGTTLRKHVATMCSNLRLSDEEVTDLANYLGHAEKIHKQYYRQPIMTREILNMSKLLETVQGKEKPRQRDKAATSTIQDVDSAEENVPLESADISLPVLSNSSRQDNLEPDLSHNNSDSISEAVETNLCNGGKRTQNDNSDDSSRGVIPNKTKRNKSNKRLKVCNKQKDTPRIKRVRWTDEEKNLVLNAFKMNIRNSSLPKLTQAEALIEANKSILGRRTADQVKAWVNNYTKALYKDGDEF